MKKALLLIAAAFSSVVSFAQLPAGSFGNDFTVTDQFGTTHSLYQYLDQGYTVFIDVSATWCGPCWNYHNTGALEELYINHGPAGFNGVSASTTDEIMVIWIDGDAATTNADMAGTGTNTQGNWYDPTGSSPVPFPMANPAAAMTNQIDGDYSIAYFPTIYRICPNRIVTEVGQLDAAGLYASIQECPPPAFQSNDPAMLSYDGPTATCGSVPVSVTIQNNGTSNLTGCTITVTGGVSPVTYNWTGNLATYEIASVNVGNVTLTGSTNLVISITSADDNTSNNATLAPITFASNGTTHMKIDILFDRYPEECSWAVTDDAGNVVASADYSTGTLPADNSSKIEDVFLPSTGCYTFTANDVYGDGFYDTQWGAAANGHMFVTTVNDAGSTVSTVWNYDGTYDYSVGGGPTNVTTVVGVEEIANTTEVSVYPNPASEFVNVVYGLNNASTVTIDVYNLVGARVLSNYVGKQAAGNYNTRVDLGTLAPGVYMMNVTINGTTNTMRVTVK